jgi:hypothetical protein
MMIIMTAIILMLLLVLCFFSVLCFYTLIYKPMTAQLYNLQAVDGDDSINNYITHYIHRSTPVVFQFK